MLKMENNYIKILYVDDEPINLRLFELTFNKMFKIITAISGKDGLKMLDNNKDIDVVISDYRMPNMNGLQFIKEAYKRYSDKSYFILSGYDQTEEIGEAIKNKMVKKYFMKPFIKNHLLSEIQNSVLPNNP
jgi:two-component system, response regulator, stage 0 sporulation protein F